MAAKINARIEAKAQGLKTYQSEKPCPRGHLSPRLVVNHGCVECGRIRSREWQLKWRRANPEAATKKSTEQTRRRRAEDPERENVRYRLYLKRYPDRARELGNERAKRWRERNPDKAREAVARWASENKETAREYRKRRYFEQRERLNQESREWRARNRSRHRELVRLWQEKNPDKVAAHDAARRARKLNASGKHTGGDLAAIIKAQGHRCAYCRVSLRRVKKHADHIVPLARGGSNDKANLQFLCQPCNSAKWAKDPVEFARERGLLL